MRKLNSERGMSLIEATIILMVLSILSAVVAPSIGDYVNDARDVKVKEDVEALGSGIYRLVRDIGFPCLGTVGATGCTVANRVNLLTTDGLTPAVSATLAPDFVSTVPIAGAVALNWLGGVTPVLAADRDTFLSQLVTNVNNYTGPGASYAKGGPRAGIGWRGAYVAAIGPDPWGTMYQANTIFLGVGNDSTAGNGEGEASGGWRNDVIVVSAGRNALLETAFGGTANGGAGAATSAANDDSFYVVTGSTR